MAFVLNAMKSALTSHTTKENSDDIDTGIKVYCDPPLARTTHAAIDKDGFVHFKVVLELASNLGENWDVDLWHDDYRCDSVWKSAPFGREENGKVLVVPSFESGLKPTFQEFIRVHSDGSKLKRKTLFYSLALQVPVPRKPMHFTLRFKKEGNTSWTWAREIAGHEDGQILFGNLEASTAPTRFQDFFPDANPAWKVETIDGPAYSTETTFDLSMPAITNENAFAPASLGVPSQLSRFYALQKPNSPWLAPTQGKEIFHCNKNALLAGILRKDAFHVAIMGISDSSTGCLTVIKSGNNGEVLCLTRRDGRGDGQHRVVIGVSSTYEGAVDLCFARARKIASLTLTAEPALVEKADDEVSADWFENWYDGLTYCTWNGLGRNLTEQRILDALQDLQEHGIRITTLIIDDNWQSLINNERWDRFEADSKTFPNGLKGATAAIKSKFPHVKNIIVWHAMLGYWEGFAPDGEIAKNYKMLTTKWHGGWDVTVVDPFSGDVRKLYDDFYGFLAASGVDGVKCDVQCAIDELDNPNERHAVSRAYQDAFKLASLKHFQRKVIYCMAMQPFIMQHALLSKSAPAPVLRNSDDFFPDIADSHAWHLFANAHNAIYTSRLHCLPDWDMFQTTLVANFSRAHALGRVISGGPIYITDKVGEHNLGIINSMCGQRADGSGVQIVSRLSTIAATTDPYRPNDSVGLLWLRNYHGKDGYYRVAAGFNTCGTSHAEVVNIRQLFNFKPGTQPQHQTFILLSPTLAKDVTENNILASNFRLDEVPAMTTNLGAMESILLTLVPTETVGPVSTEKFAVLGLVNQLCPPASILESRIKVATPGGSANPRISIEVRLKALGILSVWLSDAGSHSVDEILVLVENEPINRNHVTLRDSQLFINLLNHKHSEYVPPIVDGECTVQVLL